MFQSFSILLLFVVVFSVVSKKWLKIPVSIGLMMLGITMALLISLIKFVSIDAYEMLCNIILNANFKELLFDGLLSFLLFAGAIHVDYSLLRRQRKFVLSFATLSVIISTFLVGSALYFALCFFEIEIDYLLCLLFGALISPTDPIAALAILKKTKVSDKIKMNIEGESLLNDGVGVIVFSGVLMWFNALGGGYESNLTQEVFFLFIEEVGGGLIFGITLGLIGYRLIKWCKDDAELQVVLSLAITASGYAIAVKMGVSGPLAMVLAGLIIGNRMHLNRNERENIVFFNKFWNVLDEILNGILFLMIGLSLHLIHFEIWYLSLAIIAILFVLISRYISVLIPYQFLRKDKKDKGVVSLLTWGGLRGGISLGLAMSLPENESKEILVFLTFVVVAFSIIVQGLTIGRLAKKNNA